MEEIMKNFKLFLLMGLLACSLAMTGCGSSESKDDEEIEEVEEDEDEDEEKEKEEKKKEKEEKKKAKEKAEKKKAKEAEEKNKKDKEEDTDVEVEDVEDVDVSVEDTDDVEMPYSTVEDLFVTDSVQAEMKNTRETILSQNSEMFSDLTIECFGNLITYTYYVKDGLQADPDAIEQSLAGSAPATIKNMENSTGIDGIMFEYKYVYDNGKLIYDGIFTSED